MEPKFYYLRDLEGKPRVTVCLLQNNDTLSRGIAICSEKDHFNKAIGRMIAHGRAKRARSKGFRWQDPILRYDARSVLRTVSAEIGLMRSKAMIDIIPTPLEHKLLDNER